MPPAARRLLSVARVARTVPDFGFLDALTVHAAHAARVADTVLVVLVVPAAPGHSADTLVIPPAYLASAHPAFPAATNTADTPTS